MHDGLLRFPAGLTESTTATLRGLEAAKAENAREGGVQRAPRRADELQLSRVHADAWESNESRRRDVELRGGGRDARPGDAGGAGGGGAWMREHGAEAGFALNAILSAKCMGPVLAPQAQPYPSTAGFVRQLFEGTDLAVFQ